MSKVAVVTDSTANIPVELIRKYMISIVPLQVIWGKNTYRDSVDIQPTEFYTRLTEAKVMPTTSQPSPAAFSETYRGLLDQGYDILSVHISSKLSGTVASALQAREHFPGAKIEVIDTNSTAMSMGFPALAAARAASQGATFGECQQIVEQGTGHTGLLFVVSTLEFLRRGGRIGGAAAFLGTALNLKPLLELRDGRIEAVERVRTMSKATDRLLDLFEERVGSRRPVYIAGLHANVPEEATLLLNRAIERFSNGSVAEGLLTEISPVLGTHTGPGAMGLAFMTE